MLMLVACHSLINWGYRIVHRPRQEAQVDG